jgi:hypothetical protein
LRVQDDLTKGVVFVGFESPTGFVPFGTGFLTNVEVRGLGVMFLVTAAHVFVDIPGDTVACRVNKRSGDCGIVLIPKNSGITHPNVHNDIVIAPIPLDGSVYDCKLHNLDREVLLAGRSRVWQPGVGDEVAIIGLYLSHYGQIKNVPITRIGNIALMPGEPVCTLQGYVEAYLIETRSLAGLSGSPVILSIPPIKAEGGQILYLREPFVGLLGVLVGHHMIEYAKDQIPVPKFQGMGVDTESNEKPKPNMDAMNTGLGVVIPIERVLDIIEHPKMREILNRWADQHYSESSSVQDHGTLVQAPAAGEVSGPNKNNCPDGESIESAAQGIFGSPQEVSK